MINIKKILVSSAISVSSFVFAQGTFTSSNYPQSYESQNSGISRESAEKLLSAKELVDIKLNSMMNDPVLRNANWGFVVYDPKTKKIISSYNENASLIPASTTKLLTTETAMNLLGENFRWITQLEYSGAIEDGVLNGNLYIVGSGDPSLGTNKAGANSYRGIISDFMSAISDKGIKKVNGDIIIQTGVFKLNKSQLLPESIVWLENGNYYLPVGTTYEISPSNEKLIAKKANPFSENKNYYYISPYIGQMVYADKFEGGFLTTKLPDAPAYLANNLRLTMIKSGLPVVGKVITKVTDPSPEKREVITNYQSPTLAEIVMYTNQHSDNALAEATLRMVGFQKLGNQTLEAGRMVVNNHLKSVGFDTDGLNYYDGSGLSRSNVVTPISQVKYLANLMNEKYYKSFYESLPIGGQTGTLKRMFNGSGNGQVFAKTGTLNKVKTLAGYMKTNTGKTLVFSLLINNYAGSVDQVKSKMEQILEPTLSL
ncbi:D-alanyl-D-alanine carboxypeptidase/D-alanyl-D-alanine endopeptidase [Kaistella antarctica]|uniref:D-alanyl-D-alanine carboxypeptidase n=1 Tax=Kaistella antarctica TaxID=266748 RepID=A0A448NMS3_9FLAO|nr:D-alanyl-D-alanine carboxypeptidase/D-alanyl-D-alanine-endopeptidase [Kaistella antarctica]KEY19984.1 peptidase S13 [Kaistella antarctica]SEV95096.1 D-alanyl-D-alanine carboxypeptidase / D-alanyl-D-alanine-endopeptidase (penicillin-binding protein 4) [Kaistella antarctica]VEH95850.1 D-alanyl-D-alanine carboxypeptidase precursor [Kaistella antarctica]